MRLFIVFVKLVCSGFIVINIYSCSQVLSYTSSQSQGDSKSADVAEKDNNIFFIENFEDENYVEHFNHSSHSENRRLSSENNGSKGGKSLTVSIDKGANYGTSLSYRFVDAGMDEPTELYARYYLRFDDSWHAIKGGGKLPGPAGRYNKAGWGGRTSDGVNGWSARMRFGRSTLGPDYIDVGYYTYHAEMPGKYGENMPWNIENRGSLQKNKWYCIETYVKLNSIGKKDGILRGWIDGDLAMENESLTFRHTTDLKIEEFWLNVYYGGLWVAPNNMHLTIDDFVLSSDRIGQTIEQVDLKK